MRDARSIAALDVAERYAHGNATDQELAAARVAAWNAVKNAVGDVAKAAAWVTDRDAAKAVVEVAAWADVRADARDAQSEKFKEIVS